MWCMANLSQEGKRAGLGWSDGDVLMLCADGGSNRLILPHMGWNDVEPVEGSALFEGLETASRFYFLHSFGFHCNDGNTLATSEYGTRFVSAVHKDNVFGVQFNPEKATIMAQDSCRILDRKSVVWGKRVSVRVDLGGRGIIKK